MAFTREIKFYSPNFIGNIFVGTSLFLIEHKHKMAYYLEYYDQVSGFELF